MDSHYDEAIKMSANYDRRAVTPMGSIISAFAKFADNPTLNSIIAIDNDDGTMVIIIPPAAVNGYECKDALEIYDNATLEPPE